MVKVKHVIKKDNGNVDVLRRAAQWIVGEDLSKLQKAQGEVRRIVRTVDISNMHLLRIFFHGGVVDTEAMSHNKIEYGSCPAASSRLKEVLIALRGDWCFIRW